MTEYKQHSLFDQGDGIHTIVAAVVADAAARSALPWGELDLGRVVYQLDSRTFWALRLAAVSGVEWHDLGSVTLAAVNAATGRNAGTDGAKLDGIEAGAQVVTTAHVNAATGRNAGTDGAKLDGIEAGAQAVTLAHVNTATGRNAGTDGAKLDGIEAGAQAVTLARVNTATGRNAGTDGAKLDGIEAGAQAVTLARVNTATGRDAATDGAKLDGIEAGAQVVTTARVNTATGRNAASDGAKLDGIAAGATVGPSLSSTTPAALGVAAVGVATTAARADHVHQAPSAAGDVVGPASAVTGRIASFSGTTGKLIADGAKLATDLVTGPASVTTGRVVSFSGTTGKVIAQGTVLAADLVTGPASVTADVVAGFNGTTGKIIKAGTVPVADLVVSGAAGQVYGEIAVFDGTGDGKHLMRGAGGSGVFPGREYYRGYSSTSITSPAATWTDAFSLTTWVDELDNCGRSGSDLPLTRTGLYLVNGSFLCGGAAATAGLVGFRWLCSTFGTTTWSQAFFAEVGNKTTHSFSFMFLNNASYTYKLQMIRVNALTASGAPGTLDTDVLRSAYLHLAYIGSL